MTAEIIVANKWGIALAADSAVTTTYLHKGEMREKVFNATNKIFMLSKWRPVGVMLFNTVTIVGAPWETIIKLARLDLGRKEFSKLSNYVDYFFNYIDAKPSIFSEEDQRHIVGINIQRLLLSALRKSNTPSEFRNRLNERISKLENADFADGFDADFGRQIIATYKSEIEEATKQLLRPTFRSGNITRIRRYVELALSRQEQLEGYTGLVFCGYGRDELFPHVVQYACDIVVCGRLRRWRKGGRSITAEKRSFVLPFADTEAVDTLLQGINPRYQFRLFEQAAIVLNQLPEKIIGPMKELSDAEKKSYLGVAKDAILKSFLELYRSLDDYRRREHTQPIESTLEMLPISDLSNVAETMLNASQILKRINPNTETVGGPVDVAVISKGDGFVWIKRKHYFDKTLNPAFINKYLDE